MKENFLILNFLDDGVEITALKADFKSKEILLLSQQKENRVYFPALKNILSTAFRFWPYKIILSLDSKRALTSYESVLLTRDNPQKIIDEAELENLISEALWKIIDDGRKRAVKRLDLSDLEILLADVWVHDLKIDGHAVINPLRHRGAKIQIYLSQTFISRSFLRDIFSILPKRAKLGLVLESGVGAAHLVGKIANQKNFLFAKVHDGKTEMFLFKSHSSKNAKKVSKSQSWQAGQIAFLDHWKWGKRNFYHAIAEDLKIPAPVCESIIQKFINAETSTDFAKRFSRFYESALMDLIRGLKNAASETKSEMIYLDFPPLRKDNFFPTILRIVEGDKMLAALGFKYKTHSFNFLKAKLPETLDFLSLASFLEFYFLPREDLINHLAKRRMRWLTP